MAYDAFIKIDGIPGESLDANHEQWIEVLSFSWGETNTGRGGSAAGFGGPGRVSFQDFHVSARFSKASPSLFQACATGQHLQSAILSLAETTGSPPAGPAGGSPDFVKYEMTNILVSSYQTGGTLLDGGAYSPIGLNGDGFTGDVPVDQFTLNFAKMEIVYTSQVDGSTVDLAASVGASADAQTEASAGTHPIPRRLLRWRLSWGRQRRWLS